jgi:hypothetical protein
MLPTARMSSWASHCVLLLLRLLLLLLLPVLLLLLPLRLRDNTDPWFTISRYLTFGLYCSRGSHIHAFRRRLWAWRARDSYAVASICSCSCRGRSCSSRQRDGDGPWQLHPSPGPHFRHTRRKATLQLIILRRGRAWLSARLVVMSSILARSTRALWSNAISGRGYGGRHHSGTHAGLQLGMLLECRTLRSAPSCSSACLVVLLMLALPQQLLLLQASGWEGRLHGRRSIQGGGGWTCLNRVLLRQAGGS